MRIVAVILGVVLAIQSFAQNTSKPNGFFKVDNIRGCAPLTVTVTDLSGQCPCGIAYGAAPCVNFPSTCSSFTFTYTNPGTYTINYNPQNVGSGFDQITITVDPDTQPAFDMYSCAGDKVEINITDKTYDSYSIDFNNDGTIETTIPSGPMQTATFNYGVAGNYNVSVKGKKVGAANNCSAKVQPFSAIPALPAPVFNTLDAPVDGTSTSLQLGFTPQTDIQYQVEFAVNSATNFQVYKNLFATNTLTVPNLQLNNNYYCFRLNSHDPCANTNKASIPVCSQIFSATPVNGKNQLAWQTAGNILNIDIVRNSATLPPPLPLLGATRNYDDVNIICKTDYTYQLKANYANGAVSTSVPRTVKAFKTDIPTSIDDASAQITSNNAHITWKTDPLFPSSKYLILKATDGTHYINYANSTTPDYTDTNYDANQATCYKINYIDDCDNVSALGQPVCPLRVTASLNAKNHVLVAWTAYEGWKQGVKNYTVLKFNAAGIQVNSFTTTGITLNDDQDDLINQVVSYFIIANPNEAGMTPSTSNIVTVVKGVNLYSPTAFNPESKSYENTTFIVKGQYISSLQLRIFDRWGTMVYSSDRDEPWDGKKDGTLMPTATYVWTAQGIDFSGREFKEAGTVLLIRHKN